MKPSESQQEIPLPKKNPSTRTLLLLSTGSAVVYLSLTLLILRYFHDATISVLFDHGFHLPVQCMLGIGFGIGGAIVIAFLTFLTPIARILRDYAIINILSGIRFSVFDRAQVSIFAGVGEELLFRGALQPLLGIWLTSILFVALHGYFKFRSLPHILFGFTMFCLSVGLGLIFEWAGLIAAMTAHAVYDFIMLHVGQKYGYYGCSALISLRLSFSSFSSNS